jgi:TM2 domain-containing membrane protein YozV
MRQKATAAQISHRTDISRNAVDWGKGSDYPEVFVAEGRASPNAGPTQPAIPESLPEWYCQINGAQQGPFDHSIIQQYIAAGTLAADSYVFKVGQAGWTRVRETPEFAGMVIPPPGVAAPTHGTSGDPQREVAVGGEVFCRECGAAVNRRAVICPTCGVPTGEQGATAGRAGRKDKSTAAILAFLLGGLGAHHFYLGNILLGILYLLFCWTLIPAVAAFIEMIIFLTMSDQAFNERYNS